MMNAEALMHLEDFVKTAYDNDKSIEENAEYFISEMRITDYWEKGDVYTELKKIRSTFK